eukprot:m.126801 g.126801  ORF g.126801 m.126801 type:complete len:496 (+) comp14527_c0_seq7:132-1619(+)
MILGSYSQDYAELAALLWATATYRNKASLLELGKLLHGDDCVPNPPTEQPSTVSCGSVLLHGPPGVGKTKATALICAKLGIQATFFNSRINRDSALIIDAVERAAGTVSGSQKQAVIVVDDAHAWYRNAEQEYQVYTIASAIKAHHEKLFVIVISNKPREIHQALLDLLEHRIKISLPNADHRGRLLEVYANYYEASLSENEIMKYKIACKGFSGADIRCIFSEAKCLRGLKQEEQKDIQQGIDRVRERQGLPPPDKDIPGLSVVKGNNDVKNLLKKIIRYYQKFIAERQHRNSKSILLHGPPGTGKSLMARALAAEYGFSTISANVTELVRGEVGETEREIKELFARAGKFDKSMIILDDIHVLFGHRDATESGIGSSATSQFLIELERIPDGCVLIATTSKPNSVDPAVTRPGRFNHIIRVELPDWKSRQEMAIDLLTQAVGSSIDVASLAQKVADKTEGFSGADIKLVLSSALFKAHDSMLTETHINEAIRK